MSSQGKFRLSKMSEIEYSEDKLLGEGHFGKVYQGKATKHGVTKEIAVKVLKKTPSELGEQKAFIRESELAKTLYSSSIMNVLYSYMGCDKWLLVTERAKISLTKAIENEAKGTPCSWERSDGEIVAWNLTKKLRVIAGIAFGLAYLHKMGIIHCNLKPDNILLDENMHPHIADFGLSKMLPDTKDAIRDFVTMTGDMGTPLYMAPEIMNGEKYNCQADVFSFGMILYELMTGHAPWQGCEPPIRKIHELSMRVTSGQRPEIPAHIPENIKELIESCWDPSPEARPTMEEICETLSSDSLDPQSGEPFDKEEIDAVIAEAREELAKAKRP